MTQRDRDRLVVLKKALKKLIKQSQAAQELGISARQVKRLLRAIRKKGDKAVIHGLRGRPSQRKRRRRSGNRSCGFYRRKCIGFWTDAGQRVFEEQAPGKGRPRNAAENHDRSWAVAGAEAKPWRRCISGERGAGCRGELGNGTPASTIGWKAGERSYT